MNIFMTSLISGLRILMKSIFILCIYDKTIEDIINGEAKEIAANTYLIKAVDEKVHICLKEKCLTSTQ